MYHIVFCNYIASKNRTAPYYFILMSYFMYALFISASRKKRLTCPDLWQKFLLGSPLTSTNSVDSGECADAQARLNLCFSHMLQRLFSENAARMYTCS